MKKTIVIALLSICTIVVAEEPAVEFVDAEEARHSIDACADRSKSELQPQIERKSSEWVWADKSQQCLDVRRSNPRRYWLDEEVKWEYGKGKNQY